MSGATRLVTAEELERLPDDGRRCELVEGRIIPMSPVGYPHGRVVSRLVFLLKGYLDDHPHGEVVTEVGFVLAQRPDTVRAPDVAFIRRERIPSPDPRGFWRGPPDVAIEVLSPDDRPSEVRAKIDDYLTRGVARVVAVDPDERTVTTCAAGAPPITLRDGREELDRSDVIPGFRCRLADIFR
jgi:Uma2 family endonuclease